MRVAGPRRSSSKVVLFLSLVSIAACTGEPTNEPTNESTNESANETEADLIERARGIHERVITLDSHNDISAANFTAERNYTTDLGNQVNLPKMEAGGLDVSWMIVYVGQGPLTAEGYANAHAQAIAKFDAVHRLTEEIAPDRIELALTSADVRRIAASGKKVAMIGIENAYQVGLDLDNIRDFAERGGRYMSLSHNGHSQFSDSNTGERDGVWLHDGLSDLGRQAIAEMNRWGIMIDISHPSKEASMQMMELTRAPIIASHSSARALNDVSRNLDEEQLMALKENGGVVQTVAFRSYLDTEKNNANRAAAQAARTAVAEEMDFEVIGGRGGGRGRGGGGALQAMSEQERGVYQADLARFQEASAARIAAEVDPVTPPVGVTDLADHVDYLVGLIGIEHVGISSDFDGGGGVSDWNDASETFNVTLELVRRGYTEEEIGMIWSGNLLRVLDEVQAVAAEIQAGR